ncbi:MAG: YlbF family regulator [Oscillospiraceae bacterium]|jgi:hypothetical protein|nr:YlbF family regulator [Oscillospiraceae bacterium]
MDLEQLAREWGAILQQSESYNDYHKAKETVDLSFDLQKGLRDMQLCREQYKHEAHKEDADPDTIIEIKERWDALRKKLYTDERVIHMLQYGERFNREMQLIYGILQGAAEGQNPATYMPPEDADDGGCSGNCGGCSGCGSADDSE